MRKVSVRIAILVVLVVVGLAGSLGASDASAFRQRKVRIFAGPNATGELLWTLEEVPFFHEPVWWVFRGSPSFSYLPEYTLTRNHLFEGSGFYGPRLATFRFNTVYLGPTDFGPPLYHLEGERLFEGRTTRGPIAYNFSGERMFAGANTAGAIVANTTINIQAFNEPPLELVMGLLFGGQLEAPTGPPPAPTPIPTPPPPP